MTTANVKDMDGAQVETWCPVFRGFYGSIYESMIDNAIENEIEGINEQRKEAKLLGEIDYDALDIEYSPIYHFLATTIFDVVLEKLKELNLVEDGKFDTLQSPQFYNFKNDSINCTFDITEENLDNIEQIINDNIEEFTEWVKVRNTSYDGFIAYHSNEVDDWKTREEFDHPHKFGAVLDFILRNVEEFNEEHIYYADEMESVYSAVNENINNWEELMNEHYNPETREFEDEDIVKTEDQFNDNYQFIEDFEEIKNIFMSVALLGYSPANSIYVKYDDFGQKTVDEIWYPTEDGDFRYKIVYGE